MRGSTSKLRGDIEGLRALAVTLVLLYHLEISIVPGGFSGVDVFFVISGYLICSHLLREVDATGEVRLLTFYARRARRLLPAATLVLVATGTAGYLLLSEVQHRDLARDIAAAAVYVVNWAFAARSVDYLAEDAGASAVQHYWSLSVEEQFYIVVPLALVLCAFIARRLRIRARPLVVGLFGASTVASLAYSSVLTASSPETAYFVTPTRVWEIGVGGLVATLPSTIARWPVLLRGLMALGGSTAILLSAVVISTDTPWPGTAALLPVLGTAGVIAAGHGGTAVGAGRALGVAPLRWVGGLSYAIYLWHWPIIVISIERWGSIGPLQGAGIVIVTLAASMATRRFVENPIRFSARLSARPRPSLVMGAVGMALSLAVAGAILRSLPTSSARPTEAVGPLALVDPDSPPTDLQLRLDAATTFETTGPLHPDPLLATEDVPAHHQDGCQVTEDGTTPITCVYGDPDSATTVAVVGDSKVGQWAPALARIAEREQWRMELLLKSGCSLNAAPRSDYPECAEWNELVVEELTGRERRPDVVIVSAGWGPEPNQPDPVLQEHISGGLLTQWTRLQEVGAQVVAIADNPTPSPSELRRGDSVYECASESSALLDDCSFPTNPGRGTGPIREAAEHAAVPVVDLARWICPGPGDICPPAIGGVLLYRQGSHLTATFADLMAPILHHELISLGVATGPPMELSPPTTDAELDEKIS